jgi:transposase
MQFPILYQVGKTEALLGKNIVVTDNHDWSTEEIVQLSLDRYGIEKQFRDSKSRDQVQVNPFFHWTDSKIRCQLLTCVIALTVLRMIERKVDQNADLADRLSGRQILEETAELHSTWLWYSGKRAPQQALDDPTPLQSEILRAFGKQIAEGGVLQDVGI